MAEGGWKEKDGRWEVYVVEAAAEKSREWEV